MKIKKLDIKNYRNFEDISLGFSDDITYIVGENNLGKTNVFDILEKLFNTKDFYEDDFLDEEKNIELECVFLQDSEEFGFWGDHFGTDIKIDVLQEPEGRVSFSIDQDPIHQTIKKKFCYISIPSELGLNSSLPNFLPRNKYGKSLDFLYQHIVEKTKDKDMDTIINKEEIDIIKAEIQGSLENIEILNDFKIGQDVDITKFIATVLFLVEKDSERHVDSSGSGLKRRIHIVLYIIGQILNHCSNYSNYIKELKENPEVGLSVIIALDEPELHLHPHWQRQFINELISLFEGNPLIPSLRIFCQFIIVTHSPYMIPNVCNYALNRFYLKGGKVNVNTMDLTRDTSDSTKRIHDQFIDQFREAYFAKGVLLVEGDSDFGIINAYHQDKKNILDKHSISVIKLYGAGSVKTVCDWFQKLQIPVIPILDSDQVNEVQKHNAEPWYSSIIWSDKIHLEETIYDTGHQNIDLFEEIRNCSGLFDEHSISGAKKEVKKCTFLNQTLLLEISDFQQHRQNEQIPIFKSKFSDLSTDEDKDLHKLLWICSLSQVKSAYQGLLLGQLLIKHNCYPTYLEDGIEKIIREVSSL